MFGRKAKELSELITEMDSSVRVFGHVRKGWNPEDVSGIGSGLKVKAEKGALLVVGCSGVGEVFKCGPEVRPFSNLRKLDLRSVAQTVLDAMP